MGLHKLRAREGLQGTGASRRGLPRGPATWPHPCSCLAGRDQGLSRPLPHFGSIYHVRGNGPESGLRAARTPQHHGGSGGCAAPGHPSAQLALQLVRGVVVGGPLGTASPMGARGVCDEHGAFGGSGRDVGCRG